MTYEEKLNYHCDNLARSAIEAHLIDQAECITMRTDTAWTACLPLEAARVFLDGVKPTTDVSMSLKNP